MFIYKLSIKRFIKGKTIALKYKKEAISSEKQRI